MPSAHVLRLRRTDVDGAFLLVHVAPSGPQPLDVKLVASEGEHVYPATITEAQVPALQAGAAGGGGGGGGPVGDDEWKAILQYALLRRRPAGAGADAPLPESWRGLETVAAIGSATVTVTIRKNIGGIHRRLGSIALPQNDEEEIDPFDWAGTAVAAADDLRSQLDALQASVAAQREQVAALQRQLDGLVQAKKEHEDELLAKFAALLNAKKQKIRDQQRQLAGAPAAADAATLSAADGARPRRAGASRSGKRKANAPAEPAEKAAAKDDAVTEDDTDDNDDNDDDDDDDDRVRQQETPQDSDVEATEDEDSGAEGFDAPPAAPAAPAPSQVSRKGPASKGKQPRRAAAAKGKAPPASTAMEVDDAGKPPPRRELPFTRKKAAGEAGEKAGETAKTNQSPPPEPPKPPQDGEAGAEDEETDDEL